MILFDMDGILCNWNKAVKGLIKEAGLPMPADDDWYYAYNKLYKKQIDQVATDPDFWLNLEPIKEGIEAFNLVKDTALVLSKPGFMVAATPKLEWCRKHLGLKDDRIILTGAKHLLAKTHRILVDDKSGNCQDFAEAGGTAILVEYPYSYKDGSLTKETLHKKVFTCSIEELPSRIKFLTDRGLGECLT